MNVGREKGHVVTDIIARQKPTTLLEIGGYVGFSAILFGNELCKAGGQKYLSLELNPTFAHVARELIALAGLEQTVEIIEGPCRESLRKIEYQGADGAAFDVIFIDHAKILYLNELKLCEELGFVAPGTTVIADDIVQSNNVEYSAYVRESPAQKKQHFEEEKVNKAEGDVSLGNPNLIYETSLFRGREPTGGDVRRVFVVSSRIHLLTFCSIGRSGGFLVQRIRGIGVLIVSVISSLKTPSIIPPVYGYSLSN